MAEAANGPLSDDEVNEFFLLLRRYCIHELDQWAHWRMDTPFGEVFVHLTSQPQADRPGDDT